MRAPLPMTLVPLALVPLALATLALAPACVETRRCEPGRVLVGGECVRNPAEEGDAGLFCTADADCADPARPICGLERRCVECGPGHTELCDARGATCDEARGRCAECGSNAECTDPARSRCEPSAGSCAPCSVSADCEHLLSAPVCDLAGGPRCVQCTEASAGACGGSVCDAEEGRCALGVTPGSAGLCEPCVADAECQPGQLCVRLRFGDPPEDAGRACVPRRDAAPGGDCASLAPFARTERGRSVSAVEADLCVLRVSTCAAFLEYGRRSCAPAGAEGDASCGLPGLDDGRCRLSATAGAAFCTLPCAEALDCPAGAACDAGACALP